MIDYTAVLAFSVGTYPETSLHATRQGTLSHSRLRARVRARARACVCVCVCVCVRALQHPQKEWSDFNILNTGLLCLWLS